MLNKYILFRRKTEVIKIKIYNIYQSGKNLYIDEKENPDNKIVVNKYDNMQQTLRLISDGTLPPRLYWALRNPKLSNKYFILKLINNENLIVGTDISAYAGLWDMLLIGTDEDYIIEGTDIDQSRLTYVSNHFGRLFVRDNFLEELDFEEQCSPTFKVFYDEIMFELGEKADTKDIPDQLSDLENDTGFISGVALKDDGEGHVTIVGTTFSGGETEEDGGNIEVDDKLDEESTNPVQNQVVAKEVKTLKEKDKSLDEEVIALKERNAELEETIEKLAVKVTTDKATFHHITDSAEYKVLDFGLEGKTEQESTEGNQLFDISKVTTTTTTTTTYAYISEVTDSTIVITTPEGYSGNGIANSGKTLKELCPNLVVGETYTLSADVSATGTSSSSTFKIFLQGSVNTSTWYFGTSLVMVEDYLNNNVLFYGCSDEGILTLTNIRVVKGTIELPYEPYTNGSSPNPDYPQEIVNAGVYNEETGRYEIGCEVVNKNHWDAEYARDVNNWTLINGSAYYSIPIYVGKGSTVTVSTPTVEIGISNLYAGISKDGSNGNLYTWLYHPTSTAICKTVYTFVAEDDYIYPFYFSSLDLFTQYIGNDLQIEIGSVKTDLLPHASQPFTLTSPVPLTKWDYLTKRDGVWGWSINSRIYAITGDENYGVGNDNYITGASTACIIYLPNKKITHQDNIQYDYINKLSFVPNVWNKTDGSIGFYSISNYVIMRFCNEDMGITDDMSKNEKCECFMSYLKSLYENGNPVVITYETDTEQAFHPLPDEEQELLKNLETYYGVTNVYNEQGCPMWISYVSDPELHWNQKIEQINNALLSLGANI